ncbi:hypothetical protein HXX76_009865 [Chlamydomonas incerta]|uniref:tRNA (adenine(58)-N(1))-methyltransferase n=1 Tax=Chlamydomonas incerta TaxID=51695 RepID=A0A835ST00_CHLIN|nr:hypothetical protein HXX76_009865 [Chlamydomonas incerta]|eukprot:KAG2430892.1 hypothetical protein HXX76_009865 [Chlamydomonas incerta]
MKAVYITAKGRFENRFGVFKHQSWVGKPYGSKVVADAGGKGWVYLLRPTPELWTQVLRHRTQILYLADISMIVMQLDLRPGSVVLESGTGSGSLTHSLVRAIAPTGHVHTFEFHAGRVEDAAAEFKQHGLTPLVTVLQRDVMENGFPDTLHGQADAVFLDLPGPWKVVPSAAACLRPNGRFCGFSPCIEQVQRTSEALSANGFTDIITYECLLREYEVHRETLNTTVRLADMPAAKRQRPNHRAAAEAAAAATAEAAAAAAVEEGAEAGAEAEAEQGEGVQAEGEAAAAAVEEEKAEGTAAEGEERAAAEGEATAAGGAAAAEKDKDKEAGAGAMPPPKRVSLLPACVHTVSCRPSLEARGHTGYLIFARKFVCG